MNGAPPSPEPHFPQYSPSQEDIDAEQRDFAAMIDDLAGCSVVSLVYEANIDGAAKHVPECDATQIVKLDAQAFGESIAVWATADVTRSTGAGGWDHPRSFKGVLPERRRYFLLPGAFRLLGGSISVVRDWAPWEAIEQSVYGKTTILDAIKCSQLKGAIVALE
ncbi:hypothetical protein Slin15195_G130070 [Septoria linicola]|uniref:Uncharacterized protein n=1 Tax=Septoria linicola TaxID=215465 RepID=A0A9Q9ESK3_9PEZI|nr:hypothetical protein Slin14017_G121960 [Septoria linicola]USW59688.1 hypothetical protein Slin15195_G130070 [Septoria linicola]